MMGYAYRFRRRVRAQGARVPARRDRIRGIACALDLLVDSSLHTRYLITNCLLELMACAGPAVAYSNGTRSRVLCSRQSSQSLLPLTTTVRGRIDHAARTCTLDDGFLVAEYACSPTSRIIHSRTITIRPSNRADLACGLLVTAPSGRDLTSHSDARLRAQIYGPVARASTPRNGFRLLNLISESDVVISAATKEVLAVHAEGGFEAESSNPIRE